MEYFNSEFLKKCKKKISNLSCNIREQTAFNGLSNMSSKMAFLLVSPWHGSFTLPAILEIGIVIL